MYALALRNAGGDVGVAEEVVQEAWVRAVERWDDFRGESARKTWLCGFVVRVGWERVRMEAAPLSEVELETAGAADARLTGLFDRLDLERAIHALPAGFRQVLVLHDIEGYAHDEIAALLGIVPGTSKSQLARARRALRAALQP